ncbi:MAG: endonuclease [Bacteroidetes bacterium]|nr:endonuclease [Bacteroidota bacterium]
MKLLLLALLLILTSFWAQSQPPSGYYDPAAGKYGTQLQQALHDIIDNHTVITYDDLWNAFQTTDKKPNGKVWDMYSDIPGGTPPYEFTFGSDQCGSYNNEGDCFNREHSWPKSWFSDLTPMYSDLFHLYPTDGYVNNRRSNYPYGKVGSASWTSDNGSKLGDCIAPGYSGTVFEPIDAYKGDFARSYFYMATRYYNEDNGWAGSDMTNGSQLKAWAMTMMLGWSQLDPVSQKEIDRNNAVYAIQHNRNPFIDHPEYAPNIWGPNAGLSDLTSAIVLNAYPNPASDICKLDIPGISAKHKPELLVYTATMQEMNVQVTWSSSTAELNVAGLPSGIYIIKVLSDNDQPVYYSRIIKK